jgi:hypothetical protein
MNSNLIALLAEDETDCLAIQKIVRRVIDTKTGTKLWASKGCSTLKRKLKARLIAMSEAGCNAFIIVHDLDLNPHNNSHNDEAELRNTLESAVSNIISVDQRHICIPIEELEAWFWSDPNIIRYIGKGRGEAVPNPHLIKKPKEKLINLSISKNRKPRYSTNMNVELAEMLNLDLCSERCPSFGSLVRFLQELKPLAEETSTKKMTQ